eukprot:TRINITY_DN1657_c3_g1_i1.p1 TRINITY_DN1657_c3_g1~~TRINITY_DN1657_c3_g1_i1.p1  ORF type:complete len:588 (+),score=133.46 TRINITY_DN1657_c3_g1_i1:125-1765(+)
MAFVSRSQRAIGTVRSETGPAVGPGSYDAKPSSKASHKFGVAPFGSLSRRKFFGADIEVDTPGPGSHDLAPSSSGIAARASFASRVPQRGDRVDELRKKKEPGPGSYDIPSSIGRKAMQYETSVASKVEPSIVWVKVATAPSIPTKTQSYGYEEAPTGELVRQDPPKVERSPEVDEIQTYARSKSKCSAVFSRDTSKRAAFGEKEALLRPGPGQYDPSTRVSGGNLDAIRPSAAFVSKTKRESFGGSRKKGKKDKGVPGPGQYTTSSSFARAPPVPEYLQTFGSTVERFPSKYTSESIAPGPGSYSYHSTLGGTKISHNFEGFLSQEPRFREEKQVVAEGPGPGAFHPKNFDTGYELIHKKTGKYGAFGSTSARFTRKSSKDIDESSAQPMMEDPLPTSEAVEEYRATRKGTGRPSAAFASHTRRDDGKPPVGPGPGHYAVESSTGWKKGPPRAQAPDGVSFSSGSTRFEHPRAERRKMGPGPGAYEVSGDLVKKSFDRGTSTFGKSSRDSKEMWKVGEPTPGPGSFDVKPTWVRPTFNVTVEGWE